MVVRAQAATPAVKRRKAPACTSWALDQIGHENNERRGADTQRSGLLSACRRIKRGGKQCRGCSKESQR
jgi:hypothetical protein